jgi:hypothetical protein
MIMPKAGMGMEITVYEIDVIIHAPPTYGDASLF